MNPQTFASQLAAFSLQNVFNPYSNVCPASDRSDASRIRIANLTAYLTSVAAKGVESIWIGRDCGYRGGRRTGIALTDEVHLPLLAGKFMIKNITCATTDGPIRERTATEVWKVLAQVNQTVFLWNAFPFHPYESGKMMSNRAHSAREFSQCRDLLAELLRWLNPANIIALGADAERAVKAVGFSPIRVRHPSYGGQFEFARCLRKYYGISQ